MNDEEPLKEESISEPAWPGEGCWYILEIESQIGCPLECAVINERICAGNGQCGYDETNGKPKCFCFDNWYGDSCDLDYDAPVHIELTHQDGKFIALLVVLVFMLAVLTLIVVYLAHGIYRTKHPKMGMQSRSSNDSLAEHLALDDNDDRRPVVV